jgi:hypothetical protein
MLPGCQSSVIVSNRCESLLVITINRRLFMLPRIRACWSSGHHHQSKIVYVAQDPSPVLSTGKSPRKSRLRFNFGKSDDEPASSNSIQVFPSFTRRLRMTEFSSRLQGARIFRFCQKFGLTFLRTVAVCRERATGSRAGPSPVRRSPARCAPWIVTSISSKTVE